MNDLRTYAPKHLSTTTCHIALIHPDIPQNTGNIARCCAATCTPLHLVRPFGFVLDDRRLKRAGLDYWPHVDVHIHESLPVFFQEFPAAHCYFVSTKGVHLYTDVAYPKGAIFCFGSESAGLPKELLAVHADRTIRIPMPGPVRSLNVANAAAIVLYEVLRQTRDGALQQQNAMERPEAK